MECGLELLKLFVSHQLSENGDHAIAHKEAEVIQSRLSGLYLTFLYGFEMKDE